MKYVRDEERHATPRKRGSPLHKCAHPAIPGERIPTRPSDTRSGLESRLVEHNNQIKVYEQTAQKK